MVFVKAPEAEPASPVTQDGDCLPFACFVLQSCRLQFCLLDLELATH